MKKALRFWRIYVRPPKESKVSLGLAGLPVLSEKIAQMQTGLEPKQVAVHPKRQLAFVSCMRGQVVQAFDYSGARMELVKEWEFPEQCVEVEVVGDLCFVTTTNFARGPMQSSHLAIVDIVSGEILSTTDTGGEWSKVTKLHPDGRLAFVSNWHSHNVSVIEVGDSRKPRLLQVIPCGESPRGIDFTDERTCLVTSFYSVRVHTLKEQDGRWEVVAESPKFDSDGYSGNMRDLLVAPDGRHAWVSNLGRNLVHRFDIERGETTESILVGRHPNSIRFPDETGKTLLVSCREDNVVCFLDTGKMEVVGKSAPTGAKPTGLAVVDEGFLVTNFADGTLERHRVRQHREGPEQR